MIEQMFDPVKGAQRDTSRRTRPREELATREKLHDSVAVDAGEDRGRATEFDRRELLAKCPSVAVRRFAQAAKRSLTRTARASASCARRTSSTSIGGIVARRIPLVSRTTIDSALHVGQATTTMQRRVVHST
jgi:hypothetical protein